MATTFLSFGEDATVLATSLADGLACQGISVAMDGGPDRFAAIEQADRIVLLVTPAWAERSWPHIETYLTSAACRPAGFIDKLTLVDLSRGAAVPSLLKPLLKSPIGIPLPQAAGADAVEGIVASIGSGRPDAAADGDRHVFVVGHPGSGKSTFCERLQASWAEAGIVAPRIDPYPILQALFRIDALRADTTRFASDPICEFVIKDPCVLDEAMAVVGNRLPACGRAAIVECAFCDEEPMTALLSSSPDSPIVHVDASLETCIRNNAARGAILRQRLTEAPTRELMFDDAPDVHCVPSAYYERYRIDPNRWAEGAAFVASRFPERYRRLENKGDDLAVYLDACRAFIDATLLPRPAPGVLDEAGEMATTRVGTGAARGAPNGP